MTTLPPPPRRVRLLPGPALVRGFAWTCYWATVLATLAGLLAVANELLLRAIGRDVTVAVTSLHERPDGDGGYRRVARYTFAPGPGHAPRSDSARIDHRVFRELQKPFMIGTIPDDVTFPPDKPGALTVRAYAMGPISYGRPVDHEFHWFFVWIPVAFLPICLLLTFILHRGVVVGGRERRRLFTHGVAVPGTVTERRLLSSGETDTWVADYTYAPAGADEPIVTAMALYGTRAYEAAVPGRAVTVMYDPGEPGHSTIYECGGYRAA